MEDKYESIMETLELMADPDMLPLPDGFHESVMERIRNEKKKQSNFRIPYWVANVAASLVLIIVLAVLGTSHLGGFKGGMPEIARSTLTTSSDETAVVEDSTTMESSADANMAMMSEATMVQEQTEVQTAETGTVQAPSAADEEAVSKEAAVTEETDTATYEAKTSGAPIIPELPEEEALPWQDILLAALGLAALSFLIVNIIRQRR